MSFFRFLALADIIQTVRQSHSTTDTTQGSEPVLPLLQSLRSLALSDSLDTLAVTAYPLSLFLVFDIFLSVDIIKKHTHLPISHSHVFILNMFTWALNCSLLDIFDTWLIFLFYSILFYSILFYSILCIHFSIPLISLSMSFVCERLFTWQDWK